MDHNSFAAVDGTGKKFAIVRARFNEAITQGLLDGARQALRAAGVREEDVRVVEVPGSFEIIHAANMLAKGGDLHGIICIGAIIKGATRHDEYLAHAVYMGMKDVTLAHGIPITAGVLTVNTLEQAQERAGSGPMNRGAEAAHTALEMAR